MARWKSMPFSRMPMSRPAMMLMLVIRMLATASRCVNREAPSMAP
jgi:hypothetical protein